MFGTIIVGIDGSDASHNALRLACDLAGKYGSKLHVVHTPQPQTVAFAMGAGAGHYAATVMPPPEDVEAAAAKVIADAEAVAKDCGKELAGTHAEAGDPAQKIIAYADAHGADLIVTGRRGLGSVGALLLGSTSQQINHNAQCATLSVA
ncbi:MAG: universal stress protein [Pseudomonadota bacterium]